MVVYIHYNTVSQDSVHGAVEIRGGLEALGNVHVLASMTFPAPRAGEAASFGLTGDFSDISLDLPAGAWPADLLVGPSIAIFEMPAGARRGATVAGLGVNLGPDGIRFPIPVTITAPVHANFDLGNRVLRVHRYNPQTDKQSADSWTALTYPQGYSVPHDPRVIKATTTSFSAYFVLAVDPGSPGGAVQGQVVMQASQTSTTPNHTNVLKDLLPKLGGDKILGLPQTTFIAIVVGGGCGVICLCSLGLYVLFKDSCLGKCLACLCCCLCGCVLRCLCARCCKERSEPESSWCAVSDNMRSEDNVVQADLVVVETGKKKD